MPPSYFNQYKRTYQSRLYRRQALYNLYCKRRQKAIAATFELATVLSDLENLQKEKEKSTKRIAYLKSKLESKTEE